MFVFQNNLNIIGFFLLRTRAHQRTRVSPLWRLTANWTNFRRERATYNDDDVNGVSPSVSPFAQIVRHTRDVIRCANRFPCQRKYSRCRCAHMCVLMPGKHSTTFNEQFWAVLLFSYRKGVLLTYKYREHFEIFRCSPL